jgi:CheY-like chemotaxis protein
VSIANNGREAVEMFQAHRYDLILMDVQMPEVDGFKATATIREIEASRGGHIPIIAMTAHARPEDRSECLRAGMDEFLSKPVRPQELTAMIEWFIRAKPNNGGMQKSEEPPPKPELRAPLFRTEPEMQTSTSMGGPSSRPVANHTESKTLFDQDAALEQCLGDEALLMKMAGMLIETMDKHVNAIAHAIEMHDGESLRVAAHTVKGALGAICSGRGYDSALALERRGRENSFDGAEDEFNKFTDTLQSLKDALKASVLHEHA